MINNTQTHQTSYCVGEALSESVGWVFAFEPVFTHYDVNINKMGLSTLLGQN